MAKARTTVFYCKECGTESAKWSGQCPGCHAWNTMVEAPAPVKSKGVSVAAGAVRPAAPMRLKELDTADEERFDSGFEELNRVLGGGIVHGSLVLVGGDPGIGKSTILLQVCHHIAASRKVMYVSGEESPRQIKMRADRVGSFSDNFMLLCETEMNTIEAMIEGEKPDVVIIDSVQTMYCESTDSAPGSVSQVKECTNRLMQIAKGKSITVFVIGHVTKDGAVAGPRMLEHMVDTVLYFEGERSETYRIIRAVKNRFGATNEVGVFEMTEKGLREVQNPSEYLLAGRPENASGSVVACVMEGTRPIMVEIQALVVKSGYGNSRRTAVGVDYNRVNMILAVLEKYRGLKLSECDVYVNVVGGMRINESALDLPIAMAVISSYKDKPYEDKAVFFGEIGLSGEVRAVSQAKTRVAEALKLGFDKCFLPESNIDGDLNFRFKKGTMSLIGIKSVKE